LETENDGISDRDFNNRTDMRVFAYQKEHVVQQKMAKAIRYTSVPTGEISFCFQG